MAIPLNSRILGGHIRELHEIQNPRRGTELPLTTVPALRFGDQVLAADLLKSHTGQRAWLHYQMGKRSMQATKIRILIPRKSSHHHAKAAPHLTIHPRPKSPFTPARFSA
ncbi:hypothetical protein Nepgr_021656 [Nepenthes gracilis]|uniref:Uncharacterized protein n=1 Tax=Nepenthes gracilis TaxID=150966 RepID=A0AAD3XXF0_NEPGR|nr:hypothetical protein Nepgr_021656 [Nepenthes gracilis]